MFAPELFAIPNPIGRDKFCGLRNVDPSEFETFRSFMLARGPEATRSCMPA